MKFEILGADGEVTKVVETSANPVRIGKNSTCDVCLDNDSVSRVHAEIAKSGSGYRLSDRMSAGGTFVNKQRVSKPVMIESGAVLTFGQVSVRVTLDEGAAAAPAAKPAAAAAAKPTAVAAAKPAAEKPTAAEKPAAAAPAAKAGGFGGGFSGGTFASASADEPQTVIIKKKKRLARFERRFLSARGSSANGILEVAVLWRDNVLSIRQFNANSGFAITVGTDAGCTYKVETGVNGGRALTLVRCIAGGKWELIFNNAYEGFVLEADKQTAFKVASNAEFRLPSAGISVQSGSLACDITPDTRAKFIFGEVSILVHYVDKVAYAAPLLGGFNLSNAGGLVASLLIHFALFSVILFATDRVDALMIDRIMTASRFATVVESEIEEEEAKDEEEEEKPEEDEPDPEEVEPKDEVAQNDPTPFAANTASTGPSNSPGRSMSKSEAQSAAGNVGLLSQRNAMNSLLATANSMQSLDNLDWSSFDASAQAGSSSFGLGASGGMGGGASMGGFGNGLGGPGSMGGGNGAIAAAAKDFKGDIGGRDAVKPQVKMKDPTVNGSIDKRIIQKVVRQHSGELRSCYERELAKTKDLAGRVQMMWIISPQGVVTKALVKESTIKNKTVEDCIKNSILHWRFPVPKGGGLVSIEYPFVFEMSK